MSQRLHTGLYEARRWRVGRFVDVTFTSALVGAAFANSLRPRLASLRAADTVDGALETHMDPGPPFRVQEVEGHAFRARGGEELDRNGGQPERDVEILQRARYGVPWKPGFVSR
jgi:hypothetical protein